MFTISKTTASALLLGLVFSSQAFSDTVKLHSVVNDGTNLSVTYSKDFTTCAHLLDSSYNILHRANYFCSSGENVTVTQPVTEFWNVDVGNQVKLCHGNNYGICSALTVVSGGPDVEGCISEKGQPLVAMKVVLRQKNYPTQYSVTDAKGCYKFDRADKDAAYNVTVVRKYN